MVRNRDRDTPSCHRVSQRVGMIGTRSAISIRARGHWPQSEAVYMTAPDAFAAPQKALAERGPSIHDGGSVQHEWKLLSRMLRVPARLGEREPPPSCGRALPRPS